MSNYTKGEWEASKSSFGDWAVLTGDTLICHGARHFDVYLLTAAPDLYEACCQAYDALTDKDDPHGILRAWLRKALAKAEGKL